MKNIEKICTNCGIGFKKYAKPAKHYFCCKECYYEWKKGKNNSNWRGGNIKFKCFFCNKDFEIRRDRKTSQTGKFCSIGCFIKFQNSIAMSKRQVNLAKQTLKNLTYWLRKNSLPKIDWIKRFGYTPDEFKEHIEKQWKEGMSWENYAIVWCIDHIKAVQLFEFKCIDDIDFKKCYSLENLQPLFIRENLLKGRNNNGKDLYWRG